MHWPQCSLRHRRSPVIPFRTHEELRCLWVYLKLLSFLPWWS